MRDRIQNPEFRIQNRMMKRRRRDEAASGKGQNSSRLRNRIVRIETGAEDGRGRSGAYIDIREHPDGTG